jgi:hypothetical protein
MAVRRLIVAGCAVGALAVNASIATSAVTHGAVAGTAYVQVENPQGHPLRPYAVRGITLTLRMSTGTLIGRETTRADGRFEFAVAPGNYLLSARAGEPTTNRAHSCGPQRSVRVGRERLQLSVVCDFG